jgi:acetyltransferase-like isoleucine patch superfamily enzyme
MSLSFGKILSIGILPSPLKKWYYRMRGAKIGKGVSLGLFSTIDADKIVIGDHCKIGMLVQIKAREFRMGAYSEIRLMTVIRAPRVIIGNETIIMQQVIIGGMEIWDSELRIGDRCKIFPFCFINPTRPIIIGDEVGVGGSNYLFTHGSWPNSMEGYPITFGPIKLEDRVWLPWRVFILPGVTIGHDSVIAAGSVVTRSIPPRSLAAGMPAEVKKTGDPFVKEPSKEQKLRTLLDIFQNYKDFLRIEKLSLNAEEFAIDSGNLIWSGLISNAQGDEVGTVFIFDSISDKIIDSNNGKIYCISMEPIKEEAKELIEKRQGAWFEVDSYEWRGTRDHTATQLRAFLSAFGIRFESVDLRKK